MISAGDTGLSRGLRRRWCSGGTASPSRKRLPTFRLGTLRFVALAVCVPVTDIGRPPVPGVLVLDRVRGAVLGSGGGPGVIA